MILEFEKLGLDTAIWLHLFSSDQHAITAGDMTEIVQLPSVIKYTGQTLVLPGTLHRRWYIFEMGWSVKFNGQFVYAPELNHPAANELKESDQQQLGLPGGELLLKAECHKRSDEAHILRLVETAFGGKDQQLCAIIKQQHFLRACGASLDDSDAGASSPLRGSDVRFGHSHTYRTLEAIFLAAGGRLYA
jgi:hypothetical protein